MPSNGPPPKNMKPAAPPPPPPKKITMPPSHEKTMNDEVYAALSVAVSSANASVEQLSTALDVLVDRYPEAAENLRQSILQRKKQTDTIEFERQKRGRKIIL